MFLKVSGHEGLVRDSNSHAVLNTSKEEYNNYIQTRERAKQKNRIIEQQQEELQQLKNDVSEIKSLLTKLLEK